MKVMSFVIMGSSVVLSAGAVWYFHEPVKIRNHAPKPQSSSFSIEVDPAPHRVALYPNAQPVEATSKLEPSAVDERWARINTEAIAALGSGANARAAELFEQCHAGVPTEPIFTANLAESLARLASSEFDRGGDAEREKAIQHMSRAVELAPARADLAARLKQMKALAKSEEGMWTDESEHFQLSYDGDRSELLGGSSVITNALEAAYQQYGELFGFYPVEKGRAKIRVILYKKDGFHAATGIGHWAGGLYDGAVRVPVEDLKSEKNVLTRILRHELTHAFVHESGGRDVPGWLNEGLAQRLECDSMSLAQTVLESARKLLHGTQLIALDLMSGSLGDQKDDAAIAQAYRQSLVFVAWIQSTYGERVPYEMVAGHKKGGVAAAFERSTGVKLQLAFADFAQGI